MSSTNLIRSYRLGLGNVLIMEHDLPKRNFIISQGVKIGHILG